jgi:hypothetical protein
MSGITVARTKKGGSASDRRHGRCHPRQEGDTVSGDVLIRMVFVRITANARNHLRYFTAAPPRSAPGG